MPEVDPFMLPPSGSYGEWLMALRVSHQKLEGDVENLKTSLTGSVALLQQQLNQLAASILTLQAGLQALDSSLDKTVEAADKKYLARVEFLPTRAIAYGLAGSVLLAVLGAVVKSALVK